LKDQTETIGEKKLMIKIGLDGFGVAQKKKKLVKRAFFGLTTKLSTPLIKTCIFLIPRHRYS
jgi:hypothetical protein